MRWPAPRRTSSAWRPARPARRCARWMSGSGPATRCPTPEMVEAVRMLARLEGVLLDPVYTGKAMAGLIALVRRGAFDAGERVLFVHTGGSPALYAYQDVLR